ncbi:MAG: AAA family ATPase [Desmonostoc vinosum HA7617-LM4]|jgi:predicted ATPase/signal transduction histidine kinase|nr:AAA family ATPase [Desmonostoc vinosum HA7617-LM4]
MISSQASIPKYQVTEEIYNGSRTVVYRGYRETDSLPVVIKLLKNPYPSLSELVQFRNQYTIAKNLNSPVIIQTYSLELYQNGYALVMEDFGGISLKDYFTSIETLHVKSLEEFLEIAIALCNILDILYRERIIHKDIKPRNILINPQTKQVKLIDFSIASLLPRETQTLINPNVLEGTLAYISPEQTGRMNRGIDYRTDLYSLGVTLYEILTGKLPFPSHDAMELVHCHIAKPSPLVYEINSEIPYVLSEIINKLMAKNAEDRYQSALGLKYDLETCLHQLQKIGEIQSFAIAQRDVCDRFLVCDKLYGREQEVQTLLEAFERVTNGASVLMLVAGFSGIGKTAVVNEVHKPIVRCNGYFIKGKYDQFNRNIPLDAFVQAFQDLMGQLLSESDKQLAQWKDKILSVLGENGQVMIEVIPELKQIIGQQPPAPELSGNAAQNRFNLLFVKFIGVFTTREHPLVMFLDDLQWADSTSLNLMQVLLNGTEQGYLFIIGAYRDNEVFPAHPLMLTLEEMKKAQATISALTLNPLSQVNINCLIADTLTCSKELALPLTELVYQKTKGNPFFTTQFLRTLHEEGYITFEPQARYWQCDIVKVKALSLTDDVVEFMAMQLQKLPDATQNVLKLAACIGAQFDLETLAIISERSPETTAVALWKALQEGLIIPQTEVYKFYQIENTPLPTPQRSGFSPLPTQHCFYRFLHDRVQQAAYELIPTSQKQATHRKIGQLLLASMSIEAQQANSFEIVRHLNIGAESIGDRALLNQLAQLNLVAGIRAKKSTAYISAIDHFSKGISLLTINAWQEQYDITLNLHNEIVEAYLLTAQFNQVEQWAQAVLQHAKTVLDTVKAYIARIQAYIAQNNLPLAEQTALSILKQLHIEFPENPTAVEVQQALAATQTRFACYATAALIQLEQMTDPVYLAAMEILVTVVTASHQSVSPLFPLIVCKQIDLSLEHGNSLASASSYSWFGLIQASPSGNLDFCYRAGEVALRLIATQPNDSLKAKTMNITHAFVMHWKRHGRSELQPLLQTHQIGLETGELEHGAYALYNYTGISLTIGRNLHEMEQETEKFDQIITQLQQGTALCFLKIMRQAVLNLRGKAPDPCRLIGDAYDEAVMLPLHQANREQYAICSIYLNKLILSYLFNDYPQAWENAVLAEQNAVALTAALKYTHIYFYSSLTQLALYLTATPTEQANILQNVAVHQAKLEHWAYHAPMNHLHQWHLVEAEKYCVLGNKAEAIAHYDQAIAKAKENGFIHEEALSNELAAKFYLEWGKERIAGEYMTEAYYGYARWGATAKVADLERRYPQLMSAIVQQTRSPLSTNETVFATATITSIGSSSSVSAALDLTAVLKASQSLSGEIEFEKLLSSLLHIVIENTGADKCVLMLLRDERLLIKGLITEGSEPIVLQSLPIEDSQDIPLRLIYKVNHDRQTAVLIDASADVTLANDPYIMRQQPKSILCSPILHQGKLLGVLYLENSLVIGAFTSARVELLNLLCTQAAISLENAQLYKRSQNYAQQLERSLNSLNVAQSRFHNLVDNVPGVVYQFRMSANGSISMSYISAECYELYEFTVEQVLANVQILIDAVHPDDAASYEKSVADSIQTLTPWQWEGRIITPSGILKWIHGESRIERLADGTLVWDGLLLDISDRKLAQLALQQKSLELEQALHNLQQAQLQIVQSEKMSALGNLVAGIAHEMNNPLGFIAASIKQAKPTLADIVEHLKLYQDTVLNKSEEILDHAEEIDLDYSLEDFPKMLDSMTIACDRLKNISTSLRTFSRADQDYKVPFNIHEGIDSTILILKHRLKANEQRPAIEVITNYGKLPQIECFPGQLNQVFMNIIANAIDALEEANKGRSFEEIQLNTNRIIITTFQVNQQLKIAIADNGKGMSESVKEKIFDHLFTTKGVGKGTGLGLAIARQIIVEKHAGLIECNSSLGKGTEFIIQMPIYIK